MSGLRDARNSLRLCYWESFSDGMIKCCFATGTIGIRNAAQDRALFNALFECGFVCTVTMDPTGIGFLTVATELLDKGFVAPGDAGESATVAAGLADQLRALTEVVGVFGETAGCLVVENVLEEGLVAGDGWRADRYMDGEDNIGDEDGDW